MSIFNGGYRPLIQAVLHALPQRWKATTLLAIPDFRRLWLANIVWWQTRWMEQLIIGWVVLELTDSAAQVALVAFYRMAPFLLFGPFIGAIINRLGYRKLIIQSQLLNTCITFLFALLTLTGYLQVWHVAVGSFLIGIAAAFDWSARRSFIPDLVGKARTLDAMVLENIPQNISRVFAPLLSGLLLEFLGVEGTFPALFSLYVVELIVLSRLSRHIENAGRGVSRTSPLADLKEGLRYIRGSEPIMGVLLITVAMNALTFPYQTLLPVFARDILRRGPIDLGVLGASVGVGSFFGIAVVNWMRRFNRSGWVFGGGSLLGSLAILGFALSTSYPLSIAMLIVSGVGQAGFSVMQSSIILRAASDAMRARVMGALVLAIGGGPLGRLQIGALAAILSTPLAMTLSCGAALIAIGGVLVRFPGFRARDEDG